MMLNSSDTVLDRARVREVAGVFHSLDSLEDAGDDLLLAGFDRSEVDVIAPPDEVRRKLGPALAYIRVEELADVPRVPRQPFLADDDIGNIKAVVASTLGSIAAVITALLVFLSGGSPMQTGVTAALIGFAAAGVGLVLAPRLFGHQKFKDLAPSISARGFIMWCRVHSEEQEDQAREILVRHGANAVRVHEIEREKTTEDLPLGSIRPDPWLGNERLGQP
jgi:hypothetical protein